MAETLEEQLHLDRHRTADRISRYGRVFWGLVVDASTKQSTTIENAVNRAFVPKTGSWPHIEHCNQSQFNSLTTKNQLELSMVDNYLMDTNMQAKLKATILASASADASFKNNLRAKKVFSRNTQKVVVTYDCRKEILRPSREWMDLSPLCREELDAIKKHPTVENIRTFHNKYGHVYATMIIIGGALRWRQASSEITGDSNQSKELNFKASLKAKFPEIEFSASNSANDSAQKKVHESSSQDITNYERIGGKATWDLNFHDWVESLDSNELWEITEISGVVPIHEFIGGFSGMEWVPDAFNLVRKRRTTLPLFKFTTPEQRWTNDTRFASTFFDLFGLRSFVITLVFFQDSNDFIRWGGFENGSRAELYSEYFFHDHIACGRKGTPIAVAISDGIRNKKLHLFYADKDSQLCRRILDFSAAGDTLKTADWRLANLQTANVYVSHTSNFNLICKGKSWYLGFTTPAGENAALMGSLNKNDMTLNFGGLAYRNSLDEESEAFLGRTSLGKSYPAPTEISILQDSGLPTMVAVRTEDTEIAIRIPDTAPDISSPADEDEDAAILTIDDVETDDDWEDPTFEIFVATSIQSNFFLFNMGETFDIPTPTLIFISPDEKMEICQIGVDTGKEIFIKSQKAVFGSRCKEVYMLPYFLRLREIHNNLNPDDSDY